MTQAAVPLDPEDSAPTGGAAARGDATTAPDPPVGAEGGPPPVGATDGAGGRRELPVVTERRSRIAAPAGCRLAQDS